MSAETIHDRARGRWLGILTGLGVAEHLLSGKHQPCPMCGGKDRFRFDDKGGDGTFICSHCGAGNGVDLLMKIRGVQFIEAKRAIEGIVGSAPVITPKAGTSDEEQRDRMTALWRRARPLAGPDIASRYLTSRGIDLGALWPSALRFVDELPYWDDSKVKSMHPAMLAKVFAPDGKPGILHRTFLSEPGAKAAVARPRMIMPGKFPPGGACRLSLQAETMGIAEGIETALSAQLLFSVPVWAAISAGALLKWKPPEEAKSIIVFADRDESFAGQNSAYSLAYRLKTEGFSVEVRMPDSEEGRDWNDALISRKVAFS